MADTKTAILDAAEERFARDGIHRVSLRSILRDADLNPALAHYHFGSRENLLRELLLRRLVPLGEERIRRLDDLAARDGEPGYTLRDVLWAFTAPAIRLLDQAPHFARLLGQVQNTSDPMLREAYEEQLAPSLHRLSEVARPVLPPGIEEEQRVARAFFYFGIISYTLRRIDFLDALGVGRFPALRGDALTNEIVTFCEAGIRANLSATVDGGGDA